MIMIPTDPRQISILERIENEGSVSVSQLAEALNVSEITIRRELAILADAGFIKRIHGGAVSLRGRSVVKPFYLRSQQNKAAKQAIGRYAAEMILDGDSVALDVGTTALEIATNLVNRRNLTILTASFHIAAKLINIPDIRVILPGGVLKQTEGALTGEMAVETLQKYYVDRFFLGVGAIDSHVGLTEQSLEDTQVKRILIENSKERILVADSSKFEQVAFAFIAKLDAIKQFITDQRPPDPLYDALKRIGVIIHIVSSSDGKAEIL
jgi:DeoR/GlpR family transcriptional regulator of sugar metabolism